MFTFAPNDYFTNMVLQKEYRINNEHIITEIVSTEIKWTKKDIAFEVKEKQMKNKSKSIHFDSYNILNYNTYHRDWGNQVKDS